MHSFTHQTWTHPAAELVRSAARPRLGYLVVLSVPVLAGLAGLKGFEVGGLNYTGLLWNLLLLAVAGVLLLEKAVFRQAQVGMPVRPWLCWSALVWLSVLWSAAPLGRSVQDAVQITMPVLVAIAASMFVRSQDQLRQLIRLFLASLGICTLWVVLAKAGVIGDGRDPQGLAPRVMSLTLVLIGAVLIASWPNRKLLPVIAWGLCLVLAFVTGSRMASAALVALPILHPLYRNLGLRLAMLGGCLLLAVVLFYTPMFQQRFFDSGAGTLGDLFRGEFLAFGRFAAWPLIWDEAWRRPILGAGVGATYEFVPQVWEDMVLVHNDYLRIGFELGMVGLLLFTGVIVWQIRHVRRRIRKTQGTVRHAFAGCYLGLLAFLITACTDNPLVYNLWFTAPLFALLGAAYGASDASLNGKPQATTAAE